jgi:hypothetical protein
LLLVIAIIAFIIRARNPKTKLRAVVAVFFIFRSMVLWMNQRTGEGNTDDNQRAIAILLVIITLIILLAYHIKKPIPWKRYRGIRRPFPAEVREQVLKAQKNKCSNCNISISSPLVHYNHIDGNRSNNNISNCGALCPNCPVNY